ncbi:MFS general substrate transporter [Tuber magnatum]|uniref:MFS general substrate transporter n=1 Tax=Tuber magnatum TaxID=42249 RepID=A0A317SN91_9PEZI|nr:MFS general substrate transporter [Tuber magnatum]
MPLPRRLPFSPHIRPLHAVTYLLGVSLFSISFLVFLNATLSFVLTDLLHKHSHLGDIVGNLGFVDELVAILAAPFWGAVSDGKLGTRGVVVICYWIVAGSLVLFVNVPTVYPGLLLVRMVFSVGAAGVATMVSAILPEMTATNDTPAPRRIVITPPSESSRTPIVREAGTPPAQSSGKLAGLVGLFTGCGALLALLVFLRLPTRFAQYGPEEAVRRAFYTVAATAAGVGIWCFFGLPGRGKGARRRSIRRYVYGARVWIWTKIWGGSPETLPSSLIAAFKAGLTDSRLSLSYLAGFVARATSVGISLFIPLFVNAYFIRQGLCPPSTPSSPTPQTCREAYILAAELTGTTQLTALLLAPAFGFWSDLAAVRDGRNTPLVVSALLGVVGFAGFGMLVSPEPRENPMVWVYAVLMGAAQIGGIVCSLGLLARAVSSSHSEGGEEEQEEQEEQPLLSGAGTPRVRDRRYVKGGIAGVYSLSGGVGILALTKLGGWGFDGIGSGWPFWLLAGFECVLVLAGILEGIFGSEVGEQR